MLKNLYKAELYSFKSDDLSFNNEKISKNYKKRVIDVIKNKEYKKIDDLIIYKSILGNYKELLTKTIIPQIHKEIYCDDLNTPSIYYKYKNLSEEVPIFIFTNNYQELERPSLDDLNNYIMSRRTEDVLCNYLEDKIYDAIMTYSLWYYNKNDFFDINSKVLIK